MLKAGLRKLLGRKPALPEKTFSFTRPLVLLQSDDWGRVGVRDREGYEQLRHSEVHLGENPYDYYSLETAEDVIALRDLLKRHRDSTGRPACMVMNFLLANLDFQKIADTGFEQIHLLPLSQGLPGDWKRPGLFEAYRQGISDDVFYPALHGLTHFCRPAVERALTLPGERNNLLRHSLESGNALHLLANALDRLRILQSRKTAGRISGCGNAGQADHRSGAGIRESFFYGSTVGGCSGISR